MIITVEEKKKERKSNMEKQTERRIRNKRLKKEKILEIKKMKAGKDGIVVLFKK